MKYQKNNIYKRIIQFLRLFGIIFFHNFECKQWKYKLVNHSLIRSFGIFNLDINKFFQIKPPLYVLGASCIKMKCSAKLFIKL